MSNYPERKTLLLKGFDYSDSGAYFVTVCTKDRKCILSAIVGADDPGSPLIMLKDYGRIVENNINTIKGIYHNITIEKYVIMPNHLHILLSVNGRQASENGAPGSSPPTNTVSKFVTALKKHTNKEIGENIWQRSFFDHIIRSEEDMYYHLRYIEENPLKWTIVKYYKTDC